MLELINYFVQNSIALYIAIGLISLCVGSFLNRDFSHTQNDGTGVEAGMPTAVTP
jgi:hypothetical protein